MDAAALEPFLSTELGERVTGTDVLADGLNLVVSVTTPAAAPAYVLRCPNELRDSGLFVDLRTEYEVLRRLEPTAVPAPDPVRYVEAVPGLDGPGVVTTHLGGEPFPWASELPERLRTPAARDRIATLVVETLSEVHAVDTAPFESVCERRSTLDQVRRTTDRIDVVERETGHELPGLRRVGARLRDGAPTESEAETTLVHGDFRPGNLLFSGGDDLRVTGVLDWETAMLGDPLTELGYLRLDWRGDDDSWPAPEELDVPTDAEGMARVRELHAEGLTPFTTREGSPTGAELVARYESLTGRTFGDGAFYRALAAYGLATVWADLHRCRVASGDVAPADTLPVVEYVALVADRILDGAA